LSEARNGSKRARLLARALVVIAVLAVNVACISAILSLVGAGTATPRVYVTDFTYTNIGGTPPYALVSGSVLNPSSLTANDVTVVLGVYVKFMQVPLNTSNVDVGNVPGGSSKSFTTDVQYSGDYYVLFDGVGVDLLLRSRFDFGLGFFVVALPMAVFLPALDVYCAYRLGLFSWMKARKKVVVATVVWSAAIALVVIVPYSLFYHGSGIAAFTTLFGQYPGLQISDWVIVFLISIAAGAIIAGLETIVYSFLASLVLSVIFEVTYGSFLIWYGLGYGQSFTFIVPGVSFVTYFEAVIEGVFLTVMRMTNIIVPIFCILGVFIGAIVRSYFDPSVDV